MGPYSSERNKPEHIHLGLGPLSSIRAAFRRTTSTRTPLQSEPNRDRRRPEITILSAEPLPPVSWFPGGPGGFPPTPPPPQPIWGGSIPADSQPPPSYDQVIKEKNQEQVCTPTEVPRSRQTTTIATQTDQVEEEPIEPQCNTVLEPLGPEQPKVKKTPKPPRPSLPARPKPAARKSIPTAGNSAVNDKDQEETQSENLTASNAESTNHSTPESGFSSAQHQAQESVSCDSVSEPSETGSSSEDKPVSSPPSESNQTERTRPVPHPRLKSKPSSTEVKVQTLVRLKDDGGALQVTANSSTDLSSNIYLKELLDVFSDSDPIQDLSESEGSHSELSNQSDEDSEDMSIRAKIKAFESQASTDGPGDGPVPRSRTQFPKPPVLAPKPSWALRSSVKQGSEENSSEDQYGNANPFPTAAVALFPRPLPQRNPFLEQRNEQEPQPKSVLLPPSWSSLGDNPIKSHPPILAKPARDLILNHNNHNSAALGSTALDHATAFLSESGQDNDHVDNLAPAPAPTPPKPARATGGSSIRQAPVRKPTVIHVPSKYGRLIESQEELFPPLPTQKAIGGLQKSEKATTQQNFIPQDSFSGPYPDLSLPPRPIGGKILPPRPPPAKTAPGRPPPPRKEGSQRAPSNHSSQGRRATKKGPTLPPRPNPGHRLYNKYTLETPHAVAQYDYRSSSTGELSFQKNEVLLLLHQIDSKTYECQIGDMKGLVHSNYVKIITPLSSAYSYEAPESSCPRASGGKSSGMQVTALYDFDPEGPGELPLRTGDVVYNVEQLDNEWYMGTCRGVQGFFPINYVKVMSHAQQTPEKTNPLPTGPMRGPRCRALFEFGGEHSDELCFCEGDVILLKEYIGQEWARGELGGCVGIFPVSYVEVIEDLPPPSEPEDRQSAWQGMTASSGLPSKSQEEADWGEWAEALYDYAAETDDDLPFRQGDRILVTARVDEQWCSGCFNGREGYFPTAYVQFC
ncbi:SH3 domain-containing protein 19 isoform X2 [Denticeps clupeoides]|uniref:SH3 domain-containing protein 19 isoform X2 n=1 Tax=Denticeps clupeoides TaxID=299321 RepID=UPI0010A390AB|nr:SH3 domain-containing protein 19 isoform X2 [Denticeps clupeoides]